MELNLKQKFTFLAVIAGVLVTIVAFIGYYISERALAETLEQEMDAVVGSKGRELNGWLLQKGYSSEYLANLLSNIGDMERIKDPTLLSLTTSDKEILDVTIGLSDKHFRGYHAGDFTGKIDPTTEVAWYKQARDEATGLFFSDAYVDEFTGKLIISVVTPIKFNSQFVGATCVDISLDVLEQRVKNMTYRGQGEALIMERNGNILADSFENVDLKTIQDLPGLSTHFDEMLKNGEGYFVINNSSNGKPRVFAYTTLPSSNWILGIAVDESFVFSAIGSMRFTYAVIAIIAFIVMVVLNLKMSSSLTGPIAQLQDHAIQLSKGNLSVPDLTINSKDEMGTLSQAFNTMSDGLRNLISKMANTAHQVAAASEELTASAQQSADTSVHVAEKVGEVNMNMSAQLEDIDAAKASVDIVFGDIEKMSDKTKVVAKASNETAEAAQRGEKLMESAVGKMTNIEKSVMASADVVKKLGESSQQIGQIVEAISAISEQTNLLALNAAIEAARAGEHGRGFAVVSEEVRKLASESATSAEQIRDRITQIQHDTAQAVEAMESGTRDVQEGTEAIREVGEQFKHIMQRVDGIQQQMAGIGTSMKTVSDGAQKIVEAVESINEVSRQTSEHTNSISSDTETQSASNEEIAAASQSLAKLAEEMQEAIGKFKM